MKAFPEILAALHAREATKELLPSADLAEIFGVCTATISRWMHDKTLGFPARVDYRFMSLFRPDEVLAWAQIQATLVEEMLTLDEVCQLIGVQPKTFLAWCRVPEVQRKRAPKGTYPPKFARRELKTGCYLWEKKAIEEWWSKKTGGYIVPAAANRVPRKEPQRDTTRRGPKSHHEKLAASF